MTSMVSTTTTTTHVTMTTTTVVSTSTITTTTSSASANDSPKLVSLGVKVLLHHDLPALVVEPVHLVNGCLRHLLGWELHNSGTSRFPGFIVEQLDVGDFADLLPEEVLHLLPLHLIGQIGDKDPLVSWAFPGLAPTSMTH